MENIDRNIGKNTREIFKENLREMAKNTNENLETMWGIKDFLDASGAIRMEKFEGGSGFDFEKIKKDIETVKRIEIQSSGANDERVREFYRTQYKIDTPEGIAAHRKEEKEKNKNGQMEMLATLLFYKAFGNEFIIARASEFDDYVHGIDNVLINKKTGEVVCAFDEVHDHAQSDRASEKMEKIKKIAKKGGTTFEYGIAMENGSFKRKSVPNLPVFCVSLQTQELENALVEVKTAHTGLSKYERELCANFINSIIQQSDMLSKEHLDTKLSENLSRAKTALQTLNDIIT